MSDAKDDRILRAAKGLFLRHGFKRVSMQDIADAAGLSRPALYLVFNNKADVFNGAYGLWVTETIADVEARTTALERPREKLRLALRLWFVEPFDATKASPELKAFVECSFAFAREALDKGNRRFEDVIAAFLQPIVPSGPGRKAQTPSRIAHVLMGATRGLSQSAETADELQELIDDLLALTLSD